MCGVCVQRNADDFLTWANARDVMTTLRATKKGKQQRASNVHVQTSACQRTGARQALGQTNHSVWFSKTYHLSRHSLHRMLETLLIPPLIKILRGTRTYCSSACPLSYAQYYRYPPHTITAMSIWASPSRLTYAAENSRRHHQTLDIHAIYLRALQKKILEAISFILRYRTTCWLDLEYSLTFTMWEAHSIFTPLSAMDWYLEVKFEQKKNSVLLTYWSKKWKSQRPRIYWLLYTTSCTIHAQSMEETSGCGILGRYWSWNQRRISVLSNKI